MSMVLPDGPYLLRKVQVQTRVDNLINMIRYDIPRLAELEPAALSYTDLCEDVTGVDVGKLRTAVQSLKNPVVRDYLDVAVADLPYLKATRHDLAHIEQVTAPDGRQIFARQAGKGAVTFLLTEAWFDEADEKVEAIRLRLNKVRPPNT